MELANSIPILPKTKAFWRILVQQRAAARQQDANALPEEVNYEKRDLCRRVQSASIDSEGSGTTV
eukprot:CAMPEP_0194028044 /NCGR_PEP_ID=MMETSP0009_2-20130614/2075_1 /TAXON_ID=210454 /ORGANISM="Grammatophora oceanica, Strain CCMP 410" /LENGTH=64 /DNA_ID=CAMNT_0038667293 /DNA_START=93 /DNA_END=287 /DNA_ORIENTATION=-